MWHFLLGSNATVTYDVSELIGWHLALLIALLAGYSLAHFIRQR